MTDIAPHDSKAGAGASARLVFVVAACFACGCGSSRVPRPDHVQIKAEDYVPVPFAPRVPQVELVPDRPAHPGDVVWADGGWEWDGDRYRWQPGAWVAPPEGAKRARWVIVRRKEDGQLFFAPSVWRDASGRNIDPPEPLARARTRGGPGAREIDAGSASRTDLDE
jgi:hypothetical protein